MTAENIHPAEVISYSGYRGEERPASFVWKGTRLQVEEVAERWLERGAVDGGSEKRYFRVKADDAQGYILFYDTDQDQWFVSERQS
ncbi:MAG: hypothetical protein JSV84_00775 [Gemmatimonadota bacterium]|nr:MAG: hypothetical protein JSV84_00775 [Gemmatimonadota bacterium]